MLAEMNKALATLTVACLVLSACLAPAVSQSRKNTAISPVANLKTPAPLDTAEKQFAFAAYEVKDPNLKQECYRALIKTFSNESRWCALASINLALLYLGDFRDPAPGNVNLSLRNLELVSETYSTEKDLSARSLWLCGWICKDFLKDHARAKDFFTRVANDFGKIRRDGDEPSTWGGLSLLQICKMTPDFERLRIILMMIIEYPADLATLFAVSENLDLIPLDKLESYAATMMESGPLHAIHSSRILSRIFKVSSNKELMARGRNFLQDRFKDFPTREVRAAVKLAVEGMIR